MAAERSSPNQSVQRAASILRAVSEAGDGVSLAELARTVGLPRPTVIRFVEALEQERLLARVPGSRRVVLGMGLVRLAAGYVRGRELLAAARGQVEALASRLNEALEVAVVSDELNEDVDQAVDVLLRIESTRSFRASTQGPAPLHATSIGKLLLAQRSPSELEDLLERPLARLSGCTITDPVQLRAEVDEARRTGIASTVDEFEDGIAGLCTGIFDRDRKLVGLLHLEAPTARLGPERRAEALELMAAASAAIEKAMSD